MPGPLPVVAQPRRGRNGNAQTRPGRREQPPHAGHREGGRPRRGTPGASAGRPPVPRRRRDQLRARGRRRAGRRLHPRHDRLLVPVPQGAGRTGRARPARGGFRPSWLRPGRPPPWPRLQLDRSREVLPGRRGRARPRPLPPGRARHRRAGRVRAGHGRPGPDRLADPAQHHHRRHRIQVPVEHGAVPPPRHRGTVDEVAEPAGVPVPDAAAGHRRSRRRLRRRARRPPRAGQRARPRARVPADHAQQRAHPREAGQVPRRRARRSLSGPGDMGRPGPGDDPGGVRRAGPGRRPPLAPAHRAREAFPQEDQAPAIAAQIAGLIRDPRRGG